RPRPAPAHATPPGAKGACGAAYDAGFTLCGGACVNLQNSGANNCGACGNQCPAGKPDCCSGACDDPSSDHNNCGACGVVCVNPQTDPDNCGACGNVCPVGIPCVAGACSTPAAS
ncbi:MAG TPA: hypothetical protein VFQ80_08280, partial [Thermomicrobiales bacterium]|nr:hypothetical protein [Thermomicrobiales bacterium]